MGTPTLMSLPPPAFPPWEPHRCLLFPRKAAHREAGEGQEIMAPTPWRPCF